MMQVELDDGRANARGLEGTIQQVYISNTELQGKYQSAQTKVDRLRGNTNEITQRDLKRLRDTARVQQATHLEEEQSLAPVDRVQDLTGGANSSEVGGMEDADEGNADQTEEAKKDEVKDIVEEATKDGENGDNGDGHGTWAENGNRGEVYVGFSERRAFDPGLSIGIFIVRGARGRWLISDPEIS
jgi:hypothetical protein